MGAMVKSSVTLIMAPNMCISMVMRSGATIHESSTSSVLRSVVPSRLPSIFIRL